MEASEMPQPLAAKTTMGIFDSSRRHDGPSTRLVLEVPLNGNLDRILKSFIGAVDSIGEGLQAIALALSTKEDNSAQVLEFASKIKTVREKLKSSVDNQTKGE